MKQRRHIRRATTKRALQLAKYRRVKAKFLRSSVHCFMCHFAVVEEDKQLHHFFGRNGDLLCWVPGFRLVHPWCHEEIEANRKQAVKLGLRAPDNLFNRPSLVIPK